MLRHGVTAVVCAYVAEGFAVFAVYAFVDRMVEHHILLVVLHIGRISFAVVHHMVDCFLRGFECSHSEVGEHCAAERAVFVGLRLFDGQSHYVGKYLAYTVGERTSARYHYAFDFVSRAFFYAGKTFVQTEANAFDDCAVDVRTSVDVRETED